VCSGCEGKGSGVWCRLGCLEKGEEMGGGGGGGGGGSFPEP